MSVPGLIYPTSKGMLAGNPRDSAIANMNNSATIQAQANNAVGGRRHRRVGGSNIQVPQFQMQYTPSGGPGSSPNNIIANSSQTSMQSTANAVSDNLATKMGGSRRSCKKGGNSDWIWGCYSGGKRRTKRRDTKRKRTRKNKRKSRHHQRR